MWRYEVSYREDGILKGKGFGYKDKFEKFLNRLTRKANVTEIRIWDNTVKGGAQGEIYN